MNYGKINFRLFWKRRKGFQLKRIAILLVVLSLAWSIPADAQRISVAENARQSAKAAKSQQKMMNKSAKARRKAEKKNEKAQRKANRKANAEQRARSH
ncbi:MAG TPA: hypothetical protein VFA74_05740 [Terriglobales bacterium]|nr:hypothetical protein [Terriglobales bacterium]